MSPTTAGSPDGAMTRRRWLQRTMAAIGVAIGGVAGLAVPIIWAQHIKNVTLRQFGTGVSNINETARKAKADLGFSLTMTALNSDVRAKGIPCYYTPLKEGYRA